MKPQIYTPEENLAERITQNTDFPVLCRKAVKQIGIYYDDHKYWWIWNEQQHKWQETDDTTILNKIDSKITDSANTIESRIKQMLLEALKREGRKNKPQDLDWHWIQFKDTLINFKTDEKMIATPKYFISNPIPWKLGKTIETPNIDKLLNEWLNKPKKHTKHINCLKELFALTIVPKYFISAVPFLYGGGSDGKSQFIRTLLKFIGLDNYTSTTLNYLEKSQFGTYSLRKKLLCTVNELPKNNIDQFTNIKAISGRDIVHLEKKGHDRIKEEIYSKIFLVGNDVPICSDMSDGFIRRIILINFPNRFKEKGDVFEEIPNEEFNNLALWCLTKLKELEQTYKLNCDDDNLVNKKENYKKVSNQVIHFIESVGYVKTENLNQRVLVTHLFNEFNRWADENDRELLGYKEFKAKLENMGILTDNDNITIDGQKTRRLFAYGIDKQPLQAKGVE